MELCDVRTVKEKLIDDMVAKIERDSMLEGYDFSRKLRGIRDVTVLFKLLEIKEKKDDPFPLIEAKLEEMEADAHSYLKYELTLAGTNRTIWENDICEIMSKDGKAKKVKIELLDFDNKHKVHELSYMEVDRPSCHTTIGGTHPLLALAGKKYEESLKENPVTKLKFRPTGETEFFDFRWFRNHLVSQNHLIEQGRFVRLKKNGIEYLLKYDCYLFDSQKLLFAEGDQLKAMTLKDFDECEILEVF